MTALARFTVVTVNEPLLQTIRFGSRLSNASFDLFLENTLVQKAPTLLWVNVQIQRKFDILGFSRSPSI